MKITCICFGCFRTSGVETRKSPAFLKNNVNGILENHTVVEVENCIYNEIFFKLINQNIFIPMWVKTETGLVDYAYNRAWLSTFPRKIICCLEDDFKNLCVDAHEDDNHTLHSEEANKSIKKSEEIISQVQRDTNTTSSLPKNQSRRTKKERIPATVRNIVWVTHFQTSKKGNCWLCKVEDISSANFECGHVVSEKNGGKPTIDNLRPICSFCNKSVGTMNMEDFKKKYNIP